MIPQVPKIQLLFQTVWMSLGLILLLAFAFKITLYAAMDLGPLGAAITFLTLVLATIYALVYATPHLR